MKALGDTLNVARSELGDPEAADIALAHLEDVGAQVGRLQVGCCAPARMPLYASFLEGLMTAQRSIKATRGDGH
jgi:hypothetical protein